MRSIATLKASLAAAPAAQHEHQLITSLQGKLCHHCILILQCMHPSFE